MGNAALARGPIYYVWDTRLGLSLFTFLFRLICIRIDPGAFSVAVQWQSIAGGAYT